MEILLSNVACNSHSCLVGRARLTVLPCVSNTTIGPHLALKSTLGRHLPALLCDFSRWRWNLAQCQLMRLSNSS